MGYHLSPSNYPRGWTCSECGKPLEEIAPGARGYRIYNNNQQTCSRECALARKTRKQAERRAERQAAIYGAPVANLMPDPERSEVARRREALQRESMPWDQRRVHRDDRDDQELDEDLARGRRDAAANVASRNPPARRPRKSAKPRARRGRRRSPLLTNVLRGCAV